MVAGFTRVAPPPPPDTPAWWFIFQDRHLLLEADGAAQRVPLAAAAPVPTGEVLYLGQLDGVPCLAATPATTLPEGMTSLRHAWNTLPAAFYQLAGYAAQVLDWHRDFRYCGRCATPTVRAAVDHDSELARVCPACGLRSYPRLSPAVIVAITRNKRLLLARATRFPAKLFSVLAGFVEPGESLEACVRREVREEVGIELKNLRYFDSQPWPFPNSLMVGYTAEWAGGELRPDTREIAEADWFAVDALPDVPPPLSIARRLIDAWVASQQQQAQQDGADHK